MFGDNFSLLRPFYYILFICVYVCVLENRGQPEQLVLSFHHVDAADRTQLTGLESRYLYSLSDLTNSQKEFLPFSFLPSFLPTSPFLFLFFHILEVKKSKGNSMVQYLRSFPKNITACCSDTYVQDAQETGARGTDQLSLGDKDGCISLGNILRVKLKESGKTKEGVGLRGKERRPNR